MLNSSRYVDSLLHEIVGGVQPTFAARFPIISLQFRRHRKQYCSSMPRSVRTRPHVRSQAAIDSVYLFIIRRLFSQQLYKIRNLKTKTAVNLSPGGDSNYVHSISSAVL